MTRRTHSFGSPSITRPIEPSSFQAGMTTATLRIAECRLPSADWGFGASMDRAGSVFFISFGIRQLAIANRQFLQLRRHEARQFAPLALRQRHVSHDRLALQSLDEVA